MGGSRDARETLGGSHLSGGLAVSRRNDSLMCFKQYSRGVENPVGGAGLVSNSGGRKLGVAAARRIAITQPHTLPC